MRASPCLHGSCDQHADISMPWQQAWVRLHAITVLRACQIVRGLYQASGCHFGAPMPRACPICGLGMRTVISPVLKVCTDETLAGSRLQFRLLMRAGGQDADS